MKMNQRNNGSALTLRCKVHFGHGHKGRIEMHRGEKPLALPSTSGRVPRISRLMALAIKFQGMLDRGEVKDYAELARLGHVTRARVTQIMNLLMLAPDIQEAILFLPVVESGHDLIREWQVRPVAAEVFWPRQRIAWESVVNGTIII